MSTLDLAQATVFGVALNHQNVMAEHAAAFVEAPYKALPTKPVLFIKTPNTYNLSGKVPFPAGERLQAGVCLGVVLQKDASRVAAADALSYIAGVVVANEYSLPEDSFYRPAIKAKCRDGFMSFNPNIVPLSALSDVNQLALSVAVNGTVKQQGNTADWVRDLPTLIAEITEFMTLHAGDVLLTGTPAGRFDLAVGDEVTVSIAEVGQLTDTVVAEAE